MRLLACTSCLRCPVYRPLLHCGLPRISAGPAPSRAPNGASLASPTSLSLPLSTLLDYPDHPSSSRSRIQPLPTRSPSPAVASVATRPGTASSHGTSSHGLTQRDTSRERAHSRPQTSGAPGSFTLALPESTSLLSRVGLLLAFLALGPLSTSSLLSALSFPCFTQVPPSGLGLCFVPSYPSRILLSSSVLFALCAQVPA